ncbi:hypothetical protein PVAND_001321 [Polypedilum vanderplanki]|uniref:Odorant receptor n=1 Tax=Polypedilum vanderplanki TaxID=319348 RepID=A0A9J6BNW7_POLVA|nr:hypothetical protein PVAND_001321 [Polypedilum vanderplanki]
MKRLNQNLWSKLKERKLLDLNGSVFAISLKILGVYGIYQPKITQFSILRGIFFFSFIILQFLTASIYRTFLVKNFREFIVAIVYVIFSVNLTVKLVSFMRNQKEIMDLVDEVESLDEMVDTKILKKKKSNILKGLALLLGSDFSTGLLLSLSILFLSNKKSFTIPLFYYPESSVGYYSMFAIHYLQIYGLGSIAHGVEMVPIIFLLKMKYQIAQLRKNINKIKNRNIEAIKNCVDFQIKIERIMKKLEFYYGPTFLIQSSMISIFLCILTFQMISATTHQNYNDFIYSFGFFIVMLMKIALPCFFSQQVIDESRKILYAVYALPWYDNVDMKFRRTVLIMMEKCQHDITMRIQGFFDFNLVHLGGIIQLAYSYYSVLQSVAGKEI